MKIEDLQLKNKMDDLIELAHGIAMKNEITPDDKTKLKAINQAEKIINYQLNRMMVETLMQRLDAAEKLLKDIDRKTLFRG